MVSKWMNGLFVCSRCMQQASLKTSRRPFPSIRAISSSRSSTLAIASRSISQPRSLLSPKYSYRALYSTETISPTPSQPPPVPTSSLSGITSAILNPRTSEDGNPLEIAITPRAAHRLSQIMAKDSDSTACLRVTVESGGCHGFQYLMNLSDISKLDTSEDGDTLFVYRKDGQSSGSAELGKGLPKVAMDKASLELLEGSKIDYTMELIGSQFKIVDNPRATSSCGCGTSFDIKAADLGKSGGEGAW